MSNKGVLPNIIFVAPTGRGKYKIPHMHTVFEIMEFADDGWPKTLRLMRDDEIVDLGARQDAGEPPPSFMTAYVQRRSLNNWKGKGVGNET